MGLFYNIRGKKIIYLVMDVVIITLSYAASYALRFYPDLGSRADFLGLNYFLPLVSFIMIANYFFQIYRVMWEYSNISDTYRLMASTAAGFVMFIMMMILSGRDFAPTMVAVAFLLTIVTSLFYRILIRDYYSHRVGGDTGLSVSVLRGTAYEKRILVVGAGEAGRIILAEYMKKGLGKLIAGFVDDDRNKVGTILNGKKVLCVSDDINGIIDEMNVNEIVIAMPSVGSEKINRIASIIRREKASIPIKVMPPQIELNETRPLTISLRDISMADLIGREEVRVDAGKIENKFSGRTILITGAGGSIGSELCRQLMKFNIKKLVAVGRGEFSMYNLIKDLNEFVEFMDNRVEIVYRIVDIKDERLLDAVFSEHRPEIVFHAAAHKHVPLMEFNEAEAVQNNVQGTRNLLELSSRHGVRDFIFISTDKAVNPVNIMGATKRIAEIITAYYSRVRGLNATIVRFGNVIGSRGSVIPLFMEQIERGGPVTVTHPDVTRYFMSIPEASLLVLNAAAYSSGGELFVLDMGKQYRVADIARRLIEMHGYRSDGAISIEYTGLRPGEKMHEDLFYDNEKLKKTEHEKIFILSEGDGPDRETIETFIEKVLPSIAGNDRYGIRRIISEIIPEFKSSDNGAAPSNNRRLVN